MSQPQPRVRYDKRSLVEQPPPPRPTSRGKPQEHRAATDIIGAPDEDESYRWEGCSDPQVGPRTCHPQAMGFRGEDDDLCLHDGYSKHMADDALSWWNHVPRWR